MFKIMEFMPQIVFLIRVKMCYGIVLHIVPKAVVI